MRGLAICLSILGFSASSHAWDFFNPDSQTPSFFDRQKSPEEIVASYPPPRMPVEANIGFDPSVLNDPNDWRRLNFDVIVVINTSACGQTAEIFKLKKSDQRNQTNDDFISVKTVKVGTGIAEWAMDDSYVPNAVNAPFFAATHTGYFIPSSSGLDIDHHSSELEDAFMQYAVPFNPAAGQFTHRTGFPKTALGQRQSHGCVRMTQADARDLFWTVRATGGNVLTEKEKTAVCPIEGRANVDDAQLQQCREAKAARQRSYNLEIWGDGKTSTGVLNDSRYQTYANMPPVPRINILGQQLDKNGNPVIDTDGTVIKGMETSEIEYRPGLRTLYIVQNVDTQVGCNEQYDQRHASTWQSVMLAQLQKKQGQQGNTPFNINPFGWFSNNPGSSQPTSSDPKQQPQHPQYQGPHLFDGLIHFNDN